jgi:phage FluMu gp28-like protein
MKDAQIAAKRAELWAHNPWLFIKDACLTKDEADSGSVKRFPDLPYLRHICEVWQAHKMLAVPKSRRMMLTWLMVALHLHMALFTPRSAIFVQSKKSEDSDYLIRDNRMLFIYNNLPVWLKSFGLPTVTSKEFLVTFSNGSSVRAVSQGADQLRQYTATAVLCDEIAFWERGRETWRALRPIVQGGGRLTLISSANPGFFEAVVKGELRDNAARGR